MRINSLISGARTGTSQLPARPAGKSTTQNQPSPTATRPIADSVHFRGQSEPDIEPATEPSEAEKVEIEAEMARLGANPSLLVQFLENQTFAARARYNLLLKKDPQLARNILNPITPYRQKFVQNKDQESLRQYDALVDKIMNEAEFHYTEDSKQFKDAAHAIYKKNSLPAQLLKPVDLARQFITKAPILVSHRYTNRHYHQKFEKDRQQGREIPDSEIQSLLKDKTSPLNDDSSRYLIASGIAELIHRKPDFINQALKQSNQHPLRFVLSDGQLVLGRSIAGTGENFPGFNMLEFLKPHVWHERLTRTSLTPPHESIHLLSEGSNQDDLPGMTDTQKARFHEIRTKMEKEYRKKDNHLTKRLDLEQITALGLRQYVFRNRQEFLAETVEVFLRDPEVLCSTKLGRELYDLYKEVFNIDPLNDFAKNKQS